jgi:hypothetical protein
MPQAPRWSRLQWASSLTLIVGLSACAHGASEAVSPDVAGSGQGSSQASTCGAPDRHWNRAEVPVAPVGSGRTYYVDGLAGNDSNGGTTETTAFKTISQAVGFGGPGVTVRVKAGLYREHVYVTKSGSEAQRFVIGAFGNGEVVIDGSPKVTWTQLSSDVWQAPVPSVGVVGVVVDGEPLRMELSSAGVTPGSWAREGSTIYAAVTGGGSPAARDTLVIGDYDVREETTVYLNPSSYTTLYGLTMRGASKNVLNIWGTNVRVEKCRVLFGGKNGISIFNYSTTASSDTEIVKNEIAWNMMKNWPRGRAPWAVAGGSWGMGAVSNGTARTLYQGNVVHNNGGEGLGAYGGSGGTIYRDNVVGDNWSVNIYVDNQPNVTIENNHLYSHRPNAAADSYNAQVPAPPQQGFRILKRLRPECMMTGDERGSSSDGQAHLSDVVIRNNVMVGCRDGYIHSPDAPGSGMKNVTLVGNTIVLPQTVEGSDEPSDGPMLGIGLREGSNGGTVIRDNIVYGFGVSGTGLLSGTIPSGVTLDHNLWFGGDGAPGSTGDVTASPGFVDAADIDDPLTKRLGSASPALGKGEAVAGLTMDYQFCPRAQPPDLGAFESGS